MVRGCHAGRHETYYRPQGLCTHTVKCSPSLLRCPVNLVLHPAIVSSGRQLECTEMFICSHRSVLVRRHLTCSSEGWCASAMQMTIGFQGL
jgi:hypothetical protein